MQVPVTLEYYLLMVPVILSILFSWNESESIMSSV